MHIITVLVKKLGFYGSESVSVRLLYLRSCSVTVFRSADISINILFHVQLRKPTF